jgi:hypothetical protein
MTKLFYWVRYKVYEPGSPNIKYNPPVLKGLVRAKSAKIASDFVYSGMIGDIRMQHPKAELKLLECKALAAGFLLDATK